MTAPRMFAAGCLLAALPAAVHLFADLGAIFAGGYTDVHYELNFSRQGSLQGAIEGFKTWRLCRRVFFVFNKSSEKNP